MFELCKPGLRNATIVFKIKSSDLAQTKDLEKQIDDLVYQLYELTEEEIKIVEGEAY